MGYWDELINCLSMSRKLLKPNNVNIMSTTTAAVIHFSDSIDGNMEVEKGKKKKLKLEKIMEERGARLWRK